MFVECNNCKKEFKPHLQEKPSESGGVTQSFKCPHCSHHYPVCEITPRGIELRKQLQKTQRPKKINQLREPMKREVKRLGGDV